MPDSLKIRIGKDEHTLETKPITLIAHRGENITPLDEDVILIDPTETVKKADALSDSDWTQLRILPQFVEMWKLVFTKDDPPANLKGEGLGYRHVVGLILLLCEAVVANKRPYVRFPESYLHPSAQLGLADLFIRFSTGGNKDGIPHKD